MCCTVSMYGFCTKYKYSESLNQSVHKNQIILKQIDNLACFGTCHTSHVTWLSRRGRKIQQQWRFLRSQGQKFHGMRDKISIRLNNHFMRFLRTIRVRPNSFDGCPKSCLCVWKPGALTLETRNTENRGDISWNISLKLNFTWSSMNTNENTSLSLELGTVRGFVFSPSEGVQDTNTSCSFRLLANMHENVQTKKWDAETQHTLIIHFHKWSAHGSTC